MEQSQEQKLHNLESAKQKLKRAHITVQAIQSSYQIGLDDGVLVEALAVAVKCVRESFEVLRPLYESGQAIYDLKNEKEKALQIQLNQLKSEIASLAEENEELKSSKKKTKRKKKE